MEQIISYHIDTLIRELADKKTLLVCGKSYNRLDIANRLNELNLVRFSNFSSNPVYEDVSNGVEFFRKEGCTAILAVGGGSAMDTAKCIKLFSSMPSSCNYLKQDYKDNEILLTAIPTTAGTGSESTCHAVIYYQETKQSISHFSIVPSHVCLIPSVLKHLPVYQKKCTMLDALCQAIESWWSVNATPETIGYSTMAIQTIKNNWEPFILDNTAESAQNMLLASNLAGRAINITATTAPHAMSYKLTSLYGLPHGHAVALCMSEVWSYMLDEIGSSSSGCATARLEQVFSDLPVDIHWFKRLLKDLDMYLPISRNRQNDIALLTDSVNTDRLKNNPILLTSNTLKAMYERIIR